MCHLVGAHVVNPSGALAKACIESILNPPPPFESDDDGVDGAHNSQDKPVDLMPRKNVTECTPSNTDQTLPVPTAVKAIMAEQIHRQQNPCAHTFLAELDEELRNKKDLIYFHYPHNYLIRGTIFLFL